MDQLVQLVETAFQPRVHPARPLGTATPTSVITTVRSTGRFPVAGWPCFHARCSPNPSTKSRPGYDPIIRLDLSEIAVDRFIQHRLDQTVITVKHVKHVKWAKRWDPATGPIGVSPKLAQDRHGASGAVYAHAGACADPLGAVDGSHDRRKAHLASHDRGMRRKAAVIGDDCTNEMEE